MTSSFLDVLRRLLPTTPSLAPALPGAPSEPLRYVPSGSGGGGGRRDDPDDDFEDFDPVDPEPGEEEPARPVRRTEQQATAARRRTVQSEPDERYWTDYLRIALPVIGLLLVIAVFWFWAQQLIDDDTGTDLTATELPGLAEMTETATEEPVQVPGTPAQGDTSGGQTSDPASQPTTDPAAEATTPPAEGTTTAPEQPAEDAGEVTDALGELIDQADDGGGGAIQPDSTVVVSADVDQLNLRAEATTSSDSLETLVAGTELQVASGPTEADGLSWWQVVTPTGVTGWVAEDFIEPAG